MLNWKLEATGNEGVWFWFSFNNQMFSESVPGKLRFHLSLQVSDQAGLQQEAHSVFGAQIYCMLKWSLPGTDIEEAGQCTGNGAHRTVECCSAADAFLSHPQHLISP